MTKKHPYYKYDKVLSYNATYNFIVGGRGIGKTYGAKERVIRKALRTDEMFIYLRRYKTELTVAKDTFFSDIQHKFPQFDFRIHNNIIQSSPIDERETRKRPWRDIGYFIALSTAQSLKSVSFPNVKTIIYDEFILEKGAYHYLPNEHIVFNNFYSTVDRNQDKTKVLFLANSVSIMNPYFIAYEIEPTKDKPIITKFNGFMVCHFIDSKEFEKSVYETTFGKFIRESDEEYAKYAVENEFLDNYDSMLGIKSERAKYLFTLECTNGTFSVWHDIGSDEFFVRDKLPKQNDIFTMIPSKMDTDKTLVSYSDVPLSYLRTAFRHGRVTFDKPSTRNVFAEIFKR